MRAIGIGDLHLQEDNYKLRLTDVSRILTKGVKNNIHNIFFYGDVIDCHSGKVISALDKMLITFGLDYYMIPGNHDLNRGMQIEYLTCETLRLVTRKTILTVDDQKIMFIPYTAKPKFHETLLNVAHVGVSRNYFGTIVSGHIHDMEKSLDNLYFAGTPYFEEGRNPIRNFHLIDGLKVRNIKHTPSTKEVYLGYVKRPPRLKMKSKKQDFPKKFQTKLLHLLRTKRYSLEFTFLQERFSNISEASLRGLLKICIHQGLIYLEEDTIYATDLAKQKSVPKISTI